MSITFKKTVRRTLGGLLLLALVLFWISPTQGATKKPFKWRTKKIVVIDPGHGGRDIGARGTGGSLEKDVVLSLAQRIESEIKSKYKVTLTRTGDYGLDIPRRTDVANHLNADVFISIHTGGSFQHDAAGILIYYFPGTSAAASATGRGFTKPPADDGGQVDWDRLQLKHIESSRLLARSLKERIDSRLNFTRSKILAAPVLVIRGADMPAVLIEIGYLSNPVEEKKLQDGRTLDDIARAIANGLNNFFQSLDRKPDE
jgi:N-acetylmuramoyl-L-alanine amidase